MPDETATDAPTPEPAGTAGAAGDQADGPNARATEPADATTPGGYSYTVVDDAGGEGGARPRSAARRSVHPLALVVAVIVAAAIAGGAVWFVASSGGGNDASRLGADVTNVLNAFSQGQPGTVTTRYEGKLAPGFPGDVPAYPGAKVVSSIAQVHGEDIGYLAIYDTKDARDKVSAHFSEKFSADPWQIDGSQDGRESTLHQFSKIDDPNVSGLVLIAESKDDKTTTIIESVQVTSGAKDATSTPFTLIGARALPDGFPDDVPPYAGATLIESAYQKKSGARSYVASYITKDEASGVLAFYRGKLADAKLTVTDGDASNSSLEGAEAIQFADDKLELAGAVTVGKFAEDGSYTRIDVSVRVAKK